MRNLILLLLLCFLGSPTFAQPAKAYLSGPIFLEDTLSFDLSFKSELTFVPNHFNLESESTSFFDSPRTRPGIAMLSSAIIPGSGQAINGKWGRAAAYFLTEAISLAYYFNQNTQAKNNERAYENYADQNWSPVAYAKWLVDYSVANGLNQDLNEFLTLNQLVNNLEPDWEKTSNDWIKLGQQGLLLVRAVEVRTPFIKDDGTIRSEFSHILQDFGSQQYYELMSKYYQFQPGWEDFYTSRTDPNGRYYGTGGNSLPFTYSWDNSMISADFIEGRNRAYEFNQNYRKAGNILQFLVVNHVISAFDAFFTVKLKNSRIETQATMIGEESVSLIWHF